MILTSTGRAIGTVYPWTRTKRFPYRAYVHLCISGTKVTAKGSQPDRLKQSLQDLLQAQCLGLLELLTADHFLPVSVDSAMSIDWKETMTENDEDIAERRVFAFNCWPALFSRVRESATSCPPTISGQRRRQLHQSRVRLSIVSAPLEICLNSLSYTCPSQGGSNEVKAQLSRTYNKDSTKGLCRDRTAEIIFQP